MRKAILALSILLASTAASADQYVNGYMRSDGTYVQGYYRSDANSTKLDNYSTKGNTNPYTGEPGYKTYDDYNNYGRSSYNNDSYRGYGYGD